MFFLSMCVQARSRSVLLLFVRYMRTSFILCSLPMCITYAKANAYCIEVPFFSFIFSLYTFSICSDRHGDKKKPRHRIGTKLDWIQWFLMAPKNLNTKLIWIKFIHQQTKKNSSNWMNDKFYISKSVSFLFSFFWMRKIFDYINSAIGCISIALHFFTLPQCWK